MISQVTENTLRPSSFCEYLPSSVRALFKGGSSAENENKRKRRKEMQVIQQLEQDILKDKYFPP
jgi:hypothetical protein